MCSLRRYVVVLCGLVLMAAVNAAAMRESGGYRPPRLENPWRAVGPAVAGRAAVLVTTFQPNPRDAGTVAYVAWIDHTRTVIGLYPGLQQPPTASPRGPAEIPFGQRWRLLAAFNGGFKWDSAGGMNGFSVDGHTDVWLKRGLGTLVGYGNGYVDIVRWNGPPTPPAGVVFARQNLPLLVDHGRPAAGLADIRAWGHTLGGGPNVWRTGVGIDARGNLIYAAAGNQTPAGMATILIHAGAVRAIELDINPEWPTFDFFDHRGGLHPTMFVPNYQQNRWRYLRPDSRDFFAVYRRTGTGPVDVPFR
jgi:hypothetical protein